MQYAVVAVLVLIVCRSIGMVPVFRGELQAYLGIGDRIFGLLLSILTGAGLLTVLVGGMAVDRWGPRRVLRISLVGVAAALGLVAACGQSWGLLAAALALYALAVRPLKVAVSSYLVRLFPNNKRRVLSLNLAGTSVGALFFPSLAEGLLQLSTSIPALSFALVFHGPMAVLALTVLGASFLYRKRVSFASSATAGRPQWQWRDMLLGPRAWVIVGLVMLHATGDTTLHLWMARFLDSESFARTPVGPGYVLSGYAAAYAGARLLLGLMPERSGRKALMVLPGLLGGGVLIAGILSRGYLLTAGGYVLGAFLWSAEYPTMLGRLADEEPGRFGAALALHGLTGAGAAFLALNGMGFLVEALPESEMWKIMLLPACLFPCVGIGSAVFLTFGGSVDDGDVSAKARSI